MSLSMFKHKTLIVQPYEKGLRWSYFSSSYRKKAKSRQGFIAGPAASMWESFVSLVESEGFEGARIIYCMDQAYVRHFIIQGPVARRVEEFDAWLTTEVASLVPAGLSDRHFIVRCRVLSQEGGKMQCLVGLVHREVVSNLIATWHRISIYPFAITGSIADIDHYLRMNYDPSDPCYWLESSDSGSLVLYYQQGVLAEIIHLEEDNRHGVLSGEDIARMLEARESKGKGGRIILPEGVSLQPANIDTLQKMGMEIGEINWRELDAEGGREFRSTVATAASYHKRDLLDFNFIDGPAMRSLTQAREKKQVHKVFLSSSIGITALFSLLMLLNVWMSSSLTNSEVALTIMRSKASVLEQYQKEALRLQDELSHAERFVNERTGVANLLETFGRLVPRTVWFDKVSIINVSGGRWEIRFIGFAKDEKDVAVFLRRLEEKLWSKIELKVSESIDVRRHYQVKDLKLTMATRFEIIVTESPSPSNSRKENA